jgi:Pyruvate/2-oxoacid:ferredoxin oxidoreductase delta subunit
MKKLAELFTSKKKDGNYVREALNDKRMSLIDVLHGYFYLRWPKQYIGGAMGKNRLSPMFDFFAKLMGADSSPERLEELKKEFADSYHGKVLPLEEASKLVTLNRTINTTLPEKILPYSKARDIILDHPEHIALMECPCRASVENPCKPLDVCIIVGEPFVGFVLKHHPEKSKRITAKDAVRVLEMEDARGHVHHAFFKDVMLGRFYAICNCCQCCCGAMQATKNGVPMLAASGYIAVINRKKCVGCGKCVEYCPFEALNIRDKKSRVDPLKCMGCGICVNKCFKDAIKLHRNKKSSEPLEIDKL